MEELKLNQMYTTNEDFRNFVNKCCKTYNKTVDEVLQMETTKQYAAYVRNNTKDDDI